MIPGPRKYFHRIQIHFYVQLPEDDKFCDQHLQQQQLLCPELLLKHQQQLHDGMPEICPSVQISVQVKHHQIIIMKNTQQYTNSIKIRKTLFRFVTSARICAQLFSVQLEKKQKTCFNRMKISHYIHSLKSHFTKITLNMASEKSKLYNCDISPGFQE